MIRQSIVSLNSTPIDLTRSGVLDRPMALSIQNIMTTGYAYLGNENVTSSDYGHKLYPGQSFIIELAPSDRIFAVGDSGVSIALFKLDIG